MPQLTLPDPDDETPAPHPDDRACYEAFAERMGWSADWWDLGTDRDIPGPGRAPFVAAFRRCRELAGAVGRAKGCPAADHWGEWLKLRARQRAERAAVKGKRVRKRKA